jgi:DNA excision repair protein ERCC-2
VGFAVMGGVFAESIDLLGDRLTGAVVVGVGLPQISLERELIREYFDNLNDSGFSFAYQYPGMIKVLQAAGRVIRSETDRGVILMIDQRFNSSPYRSLLPHEWKIVDINNIGRISEVLQGFWNQ